MRMNRPKLNLIVDLVAFVCAVFLIVTGFLLEYTCPREVAASGRKALVPRLVECKGLSSCCGV